MGKWYWTKRTLTVLLWIWSGFVEYKENHELKLTVIWGVFLLVLLLLDHLYEKRKLEK